ncbi:MAG: tetratricopeptide repeat protein [Candidatus Omnitrophica bacterium]|nr:tetratricopeptide repeat protein [Candidatus Omnitrophota bacterium]
MAKKRNTKKLLKHQEQPTPRPIEIKSTIKKGAILLSLFLIIISAACVYSNSINGQFVWDDEIQVQDNKEIRTWNNLPHIFVENLGAGSGRNYHFYRPLQILTLKMDYSLWKSDVRGYHLTNITLHILTAICLYLLINLLFSNNILSLITALFFVVHPIHTEAVSYISGRADSLSALFSLLCFIFYIKRYRSEIINTILVSTSFILALVSKENALILPFLILLYHFIFKGFKFQKFIPLLTISAIYITLRLTVLNFPTPQEQLDSTFFERIPGFFVAITNYTRLLILPFDLHMEYGDMLFKFSNPKALIGLLIIVLAAICAFKSRNINKLVTFSILWFFVCLFPQSNLYRINAYMNEHWLYLPSLGIFLILSNYLVLLFRNNKFKTLSIILCVGLLSFYSFLTIKQNTYWKDPISFYERTLKYSPFSSRIYNNLARIYSMSGRYEEAIELYKKAIKISPRYAEAYNNLGVVYSDHGMNVEAINSYKIAIDIDPLFVGAYSNLGNAYSKVGKPDEAIGTFQKALKIKPDLSAYNNLAMVYRDMGRTEEAIEYIKEAIKIDPTNTILYFNLGNTYAAIGKTKEAIEAFKQTVRLDPTNANAYNNIGFLLKSSGKNNEAIPFYNDAININSRLPEAYEGLISTFINLGQNQKAIEICEKAIQADPSHAGIYNKLKKSFR